MKISELDLEQYKDKRIAVTVNGRIMNFPADRAEAIIRTCGDYEIADNGIADDVQGWICIKAYDPSKQ